MRINRRLYAVVLDIVLGIPMMFGPLIYSFYKCLEQGFSGLTLTYILCSIIFCSFTMYHMLPLYQWVSIKNDIVVGKRLYLRTIVKHNISEISEIVPLGNILNNRLGYKIHFNNGSSINIIKYDMQNTEKLVDFLKYKLNGRQSVSAVKKTRS